MCPQSNGQSEHAVQSSKNVLKKTNEEGRDLFDASLIELFQSNRGYMDFFQFNSASFSDTPIYLVCTIQRSRIRC